MINILNLKIIKNLIYNINNYFNILFFNFNLF